MKTTTNIGKPGLKPGLNLNINQAVDEAHIIMDIGLSHTKIGFAKDPVPKHLIPTPLSMVKAMRAGISSTDTSTFAKLLSDTRQL